MAQRKEIKRLEKEWEAGQVEREDEERLAREEQQRKEVKDFERVSQGLEGKGDQFGQNGRKRKAEEMHGGDGGANERRKVEDGKTEASFWVPGVDVSEANGHSAKKAKPEKLVPLCPASSPTTKHIYSLKTLVTVVFSEDRDSKTGETIRICPSCKKGLSNSSRAMLAKPCGHVLCGSCVDQFMRPPNHGKAGTKADEDSGNMLCYVCETDVTERKPKDVANGVKRRDKEKIKPGLAEISCEGTGFAGGGTNITKRAGVAFQC
jgi:nitric oxide synthase-interacting protein